MTTQEWASAWQSSKASPTHTTEPSPPGRGRALRHSATTRRAAAHWQMTIRAFPDEVDRQPMKDAFYQGEPWMSELEAVMMALVDDYGAVAVEDSSGLSDNWPAAP